MTDVTTSLPAQLFGNHPNPVEAAAAAADLLAAGGEPRISRTRAVFLFPDHVVKVPLNSDGFRGNADEATLSARSGKTGFIPIADCRIVELNAKVSVLRMERVTPVSGGLSLADWVWSVDGQQVGYDRDGRLVAYDL